MMNRNFALAFVTAALFFGAMTAGCDQRSQMEKDLDKAAGEVEGAADKAAEKLGL